MIYHNDIDEFDNDDAKPQLIVSPRNSAPVLSEALVLPLFSALPDKKKSFEHSLIKKITIRSID